MKIEGRKSREREKNVILHYLLEEIGKGQKVGWMEFSTWTYHFFPLIKKRREKITLIKKSTILPLIFHQFAFKHMSIIVIYSLSFSIIFFFHPIKAIYHQYFDFPLLLHWSKIFHFLFFFFGVRYQLSKSDEFVMYSNSLR